MIAFEDPSASCPVLPQSEKLIAKLPIIKSKKEEISVPTQRTKMSPLLYSIAPLHFLHRLVIRIDISLMIYSMMFSMFPPTKVEITFLI
jgi:hypothetical protein